MRVLKRWAWVAVVAAAWASPASAQISGGTTTGGTSGLGGTGGINAGTTSGGGFSTNGGTSGGSADQGLQLLELQNAPTITAPTGSQGSSTHTSNVFSGYFANPYYQGRAGATTNQAPGGFGAALYGSTGTGAVRGTGTARTGGAAGRTNTANQSGIVIPLQVQMAYAAEMRFASAPVPATQLSTDIRSALEGTSMISNAKTVQIVLEAGNNVILRGTVADDDERRLVEGMVRVTPGVRTIKNELTVSKVTASK